jgi:uncharacterized protein YbjT (DUF2867 family)
MILVVGATGLVGGAVAQTLASQGQKVRGLVRVSSDPAKVAALKAAGVETVVGDLRDLESLKAAVKGVDKVLSTASTTMSKQPGDTIENADEKGQIALFQAAKEAGVKHAFLVSFPEQPYDTPLQKAKRAVEQTLIKSGMDYTILRPTFFTEVWLGAFLGFDPANQTARIYGSGNAKHPFISVADVIGYTVAAISEPAKVRQKVLALGGPDRLSHREAVALFEEVQGKKWKLEEVPEAALIGQWEQAPTAMDKSFAGLMLGAALGADGNYDEVKGLLPRQLSSVRDYAKSLAK